MEKSVLVVGAVVIVGLLLLLFPIVGTGFGALAGWVVGWFFSETILTFLAGMGITGLKMWQIGAALGFIGGFFKSSSITSSK